MCACYKAARILVIAPCYERALSILHRNISSHNDQRQGAQGRRHKPDISGLDVAAPWFWLSWSTVGTFLKF